MTNEFEKIYEEYFLDVYKFSLALCKNKELAEDITQETFYKAMKAIKSFRSDCKLRVWLCQIAKNIYFDKLKEDKFLTEEVKEFASDNSLEQKLVDKESVLKIHKQLHNLKQPYKEVFSLRIFGELSFSEIAELFSKTESWARVTFYRAKNMIMEELK